MKEFQSFNFDPKICRQELNELRNCLEENQELNEQEEILTFFRNRPHLSAFIGS